MALPYTKKSQYDDVDDDTNYYDTYFKDMKRVVELADSAAFNPKLVSLILGQDAFTFDSNGHINEANDSVGIDIPHNQLSDIASRIGHLELFSTDISIFEPNAGRKWRKLFNSMINLHSLKITCIPSEIDDFQCIIDIMLRSADLPNLRRLHILGITKGPVSIDGEALLTFLAYHPNITELALGNAIPMTVNGAGGIADHIMSLIHDLRRRRSALERVAMTFSPYKTPTSRGKFCKKPKSQPEDGNRGSRALNKCFCQDRISQALSWLAGAIDVEFVDGGWQYADLVWEEHMRGICEDEEMEDVYSE